jgi:hypothetical protein
MLAGNNVFGGNLLFAFVEGKSHLSEALGRSADKWHSRCCTLQPPSGISACTYVTVYACGLVPGQEPKWQMRTLPYRVQRRIWTFYHVALGQVLRNGTVWRVAGFIARSLWIRMLVN